MKAWKPSRETHFSRKGGGTYTVATVLEVLGALGALASIVSLLLYLHDRKEK